MLLNPQSIIDRLLELQCTIRQELRAARSTRSLQGIAKESAADTIYQADVLIEPIIEDCCREWSKTTPLVLIAEGIEDEQGREGEKVFPAGTRAEEALIRVIVDPIDGTRELMFDKRSAWALAGVAPNMGPGTRLSDIEAAVMTELPTSKAGLADVAWAIKGRGAIGRRVDLSSGTEEAISFRPSTADTLAHGFSSVVAFFPSMKVIAAELVEYLAVELFGPVELHKALIFDDQYITTGGQFYEVMVGHDRFIADLRPYFYRLAGAEGFCCHPYDCAAALVAKEAGVVLSNGMGGPLDAPLDCTSSVPWAIYANPLLEQKIEPILKRFFVERGYRI